MLSFLGIITVCPDILQHDWKCTKNKNIELTDLKEQLSKAFTEIVTLKGALKDAQEYSFSCQMCNFEASIELLLKEHVKFKHEPICKFCELKFLSSEAKEKHTCKLNINNSEFQQFYIKNWILTHGSSGVYNKHEQKEIAILHNDKCWRHICPCRELPGWHSLGEIMNDEHGILHAARSEFVENGVVHWAALSKEL